MKYKYNVKVNIRYKDSEEGGIIFRAREGTGAEQSRQHNLRCQREPLPGQKSAGCRKLTAGLAPASGNGG